MATKTVTKKATKAPPRPTKVCTKCKKPKDPENDFGNDIHSNDGKKAQCKLCRNKSNQAGRIKARKNNIIVLPKLDPKLEECKKAAILRLIDNHEVEFSKLVYSERVLRGHISPAFIRLEPGWRSLAG